MEKKTLFMGKLTVIVSLLFVSLSSMAQTSNESEGEVRFISDDLYTFLHAGPGRNYRILGSVQAGTKVVQLQIDTDNNFVEVIDDKQRTGWVDATFITPQPSIREAIPDLQERVRLANDSLNSQREQNDVLTAQIEDLNSRNAQLQEELRTTQAQRDKLQSQINAKDDSEQMEWFTRGGIVALVSLILGVILTYLPKKRRRNDQWM